MFDLEDKLINSISSRFSIETELVERDDTLILQVNSYIKGKQIFSHDQDMTPFIEKIIEKIDRR